MCGEGRCDRCPHIVAPSSLGGTRAGRIVVAGRGRRGRDDRGDPLADQPEPDGGPATAAAPRHRRTRLLLVLAVVVLAADLISKLAVVATIEQGHDIRILGGFLYLTHLRNVGAAFSFAQGATILFTVIAVAVAVVIVRTARRLYSAGWATALGLVLGGAVGNLVDRVFRAPGFLRGGVVDWLSLFAPDGRIWPVFNVADSAIVCGGLLGALLAFRGIEFDGGRGGANSEPGADATPA
jgi:signal peptidase II